MNSFATVARKLAEIKETENGAIAYNSSGEGALFDLFTIVGAMRTRSDLDIVSKFSMAYKENPYYATKLLFYAGNIRGGLGERRFFKIAGRWLSENYPYVIIENFHNFPHYNRWDSLIEVCEGLPIEEKMWLFIKNQLNSDIVNMKKNKPISLLAKWMPSINASSKVSRRRALRAINYFNWSASKYRTTIHKLREYLKVVENDMSHNNWENIDYNIVPSKAALNYRNAFKKHDKERYQKYLDELKTGKAKINASTLYPYNLVEKYLDSDGPRSSISIKADPIVEAQWKALPEYISEGNNIIVMADISSSMTGRPMATSIGLATYFAQHNKGAFKDLYMSFSSIPNFINLSEVTTLYEAVDKVIHENVGYSTNLEAGFDLILKTAMFNNIPQEEMPKALVVVSDMQINPYFKQNHYLDFLHAMEVKFAKHGYTLPKLIMWNVESRRNTFLTTSNKVIFVSGQSPSQFRNVINCLDKTAIEMMLETLNDPIYHRVVC